MGSGAKPQLPIKGGWVGIQMKRHGLFRTWNLRNLFHLGPAFAVFSGIALDGSREARHPYPARKGTANHRPHHFTEDFLYVGEWENLPFLLCTYVRDSYNGYGKYPPGTALYGSKVGVFKLNTPIKSTAWVLNQSAKLPVPTLGTAKIRYSERISPFCYVRAYRTCTYVHSENPKTHYMRDSLWP